MFDWFPPNHSKQIIDIFIHEAKQAVFQEAGLFCRVKIPFGFSERVHPLLI